MYTAQDSNELVIFSAWEDLKHCKLSGVTLYCQATHVVNTWPVYIYTFFLKFGLFLYMYLSLYSLMYNILGLMWSCNDLQCIFICLIPILACAKGRTWIRGPRRSKKVYYIPDITHFCAISCQVLRSGGNFT